MLYFDIETYSPVDLKACGAYKYAKHPDTEIMLLAYAVDDSDVLVLDLTNGDSVDEFFYTYQDNDAELCAHNANFERTLIRESAGYDFPLEQWHDTMVLALTCGLMASLDGICRSLKFPENEAKNADGKKLINRFCKPAPGNHKTRRYTRETHPDEWEAFKDYCAHDVIATRKIWKELPKANYEKERKYWLLDQKINDRGLPIDTELAHKAITLSEDAIDAANEQLSRDTGKAVTKVTQHARLKKWVNAHGVPIKATNKECIADALANMKMSDLVRRVLGLRQTAGKSSVAKYSAALNAEVDGRLYGSLQFYGARTGRWAGRQLQPQNMFRPTIKDIGVAVEAVKEGVVAELYDDVMEVASSCVRAVIAAPHGYKLVVSDLANIEGRMLAWLAGEEWKLEAFRAYDAGTGPDVYKLAYANAFGLNVETINDFQRQVGKVMELALGFQGWVGAFQQMAASYGVDLPEARVMELARAWREDHPNIKQFWKDTERAALNAVKNNKAYNAGGYTTWQCQTDDYGRTWLICKLPSGRFIVYYDPKIQRITDDHGTRDVLTFMGLDTYTRKWTRLQTYGGKLVENVTQASARDVLAEGMIKAEWDGFGAVLTVHDEVVTECPDENLWQHEQLGSNLTSNPSWCRDLPLAAEGYQSRFYKK